MSRQSGPKARCHWYVLIERLRTLAYNHPSGSAQPSRADESLTQTLQAALVDVRVLDHFVVTSTQAVSMAELGLL